MAAAAKEAKIKRSETIRLQELQDEEDRINDSCCPISTDEKNPSGCARKACDSFCKSITRCCIACEKTHCCIFHSFKFGYTCNFIFSHAAFWPLAFIAIYNYGYTDSYKSMRVGGIEQMAVVSGHAGQGVFPVMLMTTAVSTFLYLSALASYIYGVCYPVDDD